MDTHKDDRTMVSFFFFEQMRYFLKISKPASIKLDDR